MLTGTDENRCIGTGAVNRLHRAPLATGGTKARARDALHFGGNACRRWRGVQRVQWLIGGGQCCGTQVLGGRIKRFECDAQSARLHAGAHVGHDLAGLQAAVTRRPARAPLEHLQQ